MKRRRLVAMIIGSTVVISGCGGGSRSAMTGEVTQEVFSGWSRVRHVGFSADGSKVAFVGETGDRETSRLAVGGLGTRAAAISPEDRWVNDVAWMPDSSTLLVSSTTLDLADYVSRLAIVDLEGNRLRDVKLDEDLLITEGMVVLPGGESAIISAQPPVDREMPSDLYEVDLRSGATENITGTPTTTELEPRLLNDRQILFSGGDLVATVHEPTGWIGRLDMHSREVTTLSSKNEVAGTATVAPDGDTIIYDSFPKNERERLTLWMLVLDGKRTLRKRLSVPAGLSPTLAPNGRQLVITTPAGIDIVDLDPAI